MSYILEALRKAEQQRRLGNVPGLDEAQTVDSSVRQRWKWGWVALGVMNIVLLALLFWPDSNQQQSDENVARSVEQESNSVTLAERQPSVEPETYQQSLASKDRLQTPHDVTGNQLSNPKLRAIPPPPQPVAKKIKPGRVIQAETVTQPVTESGVTAADTEVESSDLPVWPQLSAGLLSQIGDSLRMDVHVYADRPEERFVLINLQKYREGERLTEGPTLEAVTPEGAVMSFQGERFRINAK